MISFVFFANDVVPSSPPPTGIAVGKRNTGVNDDSPVSRNPLLNYDGGRDVCRKAAAHPQQHNTTKRPKVLITNGILHVVEEPRL